MFCKIKVRNVLIKNYKKGNGCILYTTNNFSKLKHKVDRCARSVKVGNVVLFTKTLNVDKTGNN